MNFDPQTITAEQLFDPEVTEADLASVAAVRSDLWSAISAHPKAYPALKQWIAQRQAEVPQPGEAADSSFEKETLPAGSAPQESTAAQGEASAPDTAQDEPTEPGVGEKISAGVRGAAEDTKTFFTDTVAPAASNFADRVQESASAVGGPAGIPQWIYYSIYGCYALLTFFLFLPIVKFDLGGVVVGLNYFTQVEGAFIILFFAAGAGLVAAGKSTGKFELRVAAAVVGGLSAIFAIVDGFATFSKIHKLETAGVSAGAGPVLLGVGGIALAVIVVLYALAVVNSNKSK